MKDQSVIKGNLSQINAFLMAKHGLMKLDQIRPIFVSYFGDFWREKRKGDKGREEEEEEEEEEQRYGF